MKDVEKRIHPDLKPWNELSENVRRYDLEAVKLIPELLALNRQGMYRPGATVKTNSSVRQEATSAD